MDTNEIVSLILGIVMIIVGMSALIYLANKFGTKEKEQRDKMIDIKERQAKALEKIAEYYSNLHI